MTDNPYSLKLQTAGYQLSRSPYFYSFLVFLVYFLVGYIYWGDHSEMVWSFQVLNFIIAYFAFYKVGRTLKIYLIYILPFWIISNVPVLLLNFKESLCYCFTYMTVSPIVTFLAFLSVRNKLWIIPAAVLIWLNWYYIFPNSFLYFARDQNSERVKPFRNIHLVDKDSLSRDIDRDKLVVVDFYSTYCGVCFSKFPEYERLKKKYESNPKIVFYGIHVAHKNKDTFSKSIHRLDKYDYSFGRLYSLSSKEIEDSLGFNLFPQLFLVKNGSIVYQGFLETDPKIKVDNTIDLIERHLKD